MVPSDDKGIFCYHHHGFTLLVRREIILSIEWIEFETKNSSTRDEFFVFHGRTNRKGYIHLSIYLKMRKRQYGNRWVTQFVPLCREEVSRLE